MKKLIIAAAFVCVAAVSQASNFMWGLGSCDYYDKDGSTYLDYGKAFLYLGTVTASDSAFNIGSATLLASSAFDSVNYIYGNLTTLSSSDLLTSVDAGQKYSIVLVNSDVDTLVDFEGNYAIVSGESEKISVPGQTVSYYALFANSTDTITTSNTMSAVPEPTSGLLLLLGVAGLALRRRRA